MPREIKPKSWTPAGFGGNADFISKRDRAKIEAVLGKPISDERLHGIAIALGEISDDREIDTGWPTRGEVLAGLEKVLESAKTLKNTLFNLDAIGDEALSEHFAKQSGLNALNTHKEFRQIDNYLKKLVSGATSAIKDIKTVKHNHQKFSTKPNQPLYNCIAKLGKIYEAETGEPPKAYYNEYHNKKGPFNIFVETCLGCSHDEFYFLSEPGNEYSLNKSIQKALRKERKD